jgi:hypothetical protein
MRRAALVLALALAGCAHSPQEIRADGIGSETRSSRPPLEAAACVARHAEAMTFGVFLESPIVSSRPIGAGALEIVIHPTSWSGPLGYATVDQAAAGARIRTWYLDSPRVLGIGQLAKVADGC